ncbi:LAETG motif-containing sortase-dependent surface protein [Streptomyces sp. cmx-18-6]|uniref:LAETG motif-containing sortase-dependent surface protein n=1 Tax=Streptomyces sp. cmx-18-6 TaxID=2790930 RepID=UPI00397EA264
MTIPRRSWRAAGTLVAAAVVGLTGGVISAGPAAAHTPTWAVTCSEVTVDLKYYTPGVPNTVTVTVDGKDLLPTETFDKEFNRKLTLPEHSEPVTVRLVVKDGNKNDKYSYEGEKTADVCKGKPTPTPTETEPTPTPTETEPTPTPTESTPSETPGTQTPEPSDTPSGEPSESAPAVPAPSPTTPPLAETGSSSATPVIGGAAVAVLLAGGGILWAVRKRRATQS